jgi:uncharacterized membrane protein
VATGGASAVVELGTSGTQTIDRDDGDRFTLTPSGAVTLATDNFADMDEATLALIDSYGKISYPATWRGTFPTLRRCGTSLLNVSYINGEYYMRDLGNFYRADIYTKLLIHGNGANNSTTVYDDSPDNVTVTANGGAKISTNYYKFGGSSVLLSATGDYLSTTNSTNFNMQKTGDWTVDFWMYMTSMPTAEATLFHFWNAVLGTNSGLHLHISTAGVISVDNGLTAGTVSGGSLTTDTWHHVALTKENTTIKLYIGGTNVDSDAMQDYGDSDNTPVRIGRYAGGSLTNDFIGYIDEFRVSRIARWTANFTPPTTES